jgi:dCMP deaminase
MGREKPVPDRIPLEEVYLRMAEELAKRSTCQRWPAASVVATADLTQLLGIGYTGNARGLPNACLPGPGGCSCIHAEINALVKANAAATGKVIFCTIAPCPGCARVVINSNVARVYYRQPFTEEAGVLLLRQVGINAVHYHCWRGLWR